MIAYLDTHVVLWLAAGEHERLSKAAKRLINVGDPLVSPMVLLELTYLHEIGRIRLNGRDILEKLSADIGVVICDKPYLDIVLLAELEKWTRDPFDRMIVAHAKLNGIAPLITADDKIREHYMNAVW